MRTAFIKTIIELARKDDRIFLITSDIGFSVLEEFQQQFPDKFLNVGVAESNSIGIASGLALKGRIVFVYGIASFLIMRPFEQIRLDVAYMETNIRLVGVGAGLSYGALGATHHAIEDIAIMRALPNMTVLSPGDPWEVEMAVRESIEYKGPIYLRLGKSGEKLINKTGTSFKIGKINIINNGKDIYIFTTGNTLELSKNIVDKLFEHNIHSTLISVHTVKPLEIDYINRIISSEKPIFTIEEHNSIGGLGSAIAEIIAESDFNPAYMKFSIPDEYSHFVGSQNFIREKFGLSIENITKKILTKIANNNLK